MHSKPGALFGLTLIGWLAYHLFSLETAVVLFLYGAHLKALFPSPPIPETVFYGAICLGIGVLIVYRDGIYRRGIPIVVAGLAFTAWVLLSYGWTQSTTLARENLAFVLGINLWALLVGACIVAGSRERVLRFLLLMMLLGTVLAAIGSYISIVHGNFRFYTGPYGEWHHRTYLAWSNTLSVGTAVALSLTLQTRWGSPKQILAVAVLACCMFFLMVSAARGALLGAILAGAAAIFLKAPRIREGRIEMPRAQIMALLLVTGFIGYIGYLIATGHATITVARFLQLFEQADDPLLRAGANRFDYFAGAYRAWLDSPIIGQGLSGFTIFFCGFDSPGCHPHNVVLQTLADYGTIGFILFAVFAGSALRHLRPSALQRDPLRMTVMMAFVTVIVYAMVAIDLSTTHRLYFFLGLLALRPLAGEEGEEEGEAQEEDEQEEDEEEEGEEGLPDGRIRRAGRP